MPARQGRNLGRTEVSFSVNQYLTNPLQLREPYGNNGSAPLSYNFRHKMGRSWVTIEVTVDIAGLIIDDATGHRNDSGHHGPYAGAHSDSLSLSIQRPMPSRIIVYPQVAILVKEPSARLN